MFPKHTSTFPAFIHTLTASLPLPIFAHLSSKTCVNYNFFHKTCSEPSCPSTHPVRAPVLQHYWHWAPSCPTCMLPQGLTHMCVWHSKLWLKLLLWRQGKNQCLLNPHSPLHILIERHHSYRWVWALEPCHAQSMKKQSQIWQFFSLHP